MESFAAYFQEFWLCLAMALLAIAAIFLLVRAVVRAGKCLFVLSLSAVAAVCGGGKTNLLMRVVVRPDSQAAGQSQPETRGAPGGRISFGWDRRGAWQRSEWLQFAYGWVFPHGTNHLQGVEVVSSGAVWSSPFNDNAIAAVANPFSIVPGVSSFFVERTPSNTYRFVWTDAAVHRDLNDLASASFELFRNGDIAVTTNGVTELVERELPFHHDGFGQDDAWVSANFTNAAEVIAVGYPQWVDSQVGVGLTNGLYKFTASFYEEPPETVKLDVGDLSVAVTNAGEYVFLLEKGRDYEYGTTPFMTNVAYSAVDDIGSSLRQGVSAGSREWTTDGGYGNEPQTEETPGRVWWMPLFFGSPGVSHLWPWSDSPVFSAQFSDFRTPPAATYTWTASEGLTVVSPSSPATAVVAESMPSWAQASLSVRATLGNHTLVSRLEGLTYGTNDTPQVHLSLNVPDAVLLNSNVVDAAKVVQAGWAFSSDVPTSGIVRVTCLLDSDKVNCIGLTGEWTVSDFDAVESSVEGVAVSSAVGDVVFRMEFDAGGETNVVERALTVVKINDVVVPSAPADGLVVLTNTPVALLLGCEPQGAEAFLSTLWQARRLKSDGSCDDWQLLAVNYAGATTVFTPTVGGVYQIRAMASVAAGGADERHYVWDADEDRSIGLKKKGDLKAVGVCDEQWQIDLRNCAKGYIGSTDYAFNTHLDGEYGFSSVGDSQWKCNYFVAYRIREVGLGCPVQRQRYWRMYPPLANEWANTTPIDGWEHLGMTSCLQPGFVIGHPAPDNGHVGIVDFDGGVIAAGFENVNRKFKGWLDGTSGVNKLSSATSSGGEQ